MMQRVKYTIFLFFLFDSYLYSQQITKLLEEGHRLYEEELDFESAIEVFKQVVESKNALDREKLEALEYIAASYYALNNMEEAEKTLRKIVEINPEYHLRGQTHPPELHELLEKIRQEYKEELKKKEEEERKKKELEQKEELEIVVYEESKKKREWYKEWWFWTIVGVVVAGGVTAGIVAGVSSGGEAEPPKGNVPPYVIELPDR